MTKYNVSIHVDARNDLTSLRDHIATDRGLQIADGFIGKVLRHLSSFETNPHRGRRRNDIRPGLRVIGWRKALTIAFSVDDATRDVVVFAILYRGRDVEGVLQQRLP